MAAVAWMGMRLSLSAAARGLSVCGLLCGFVRLTAQAASRPSSAAAFSKARALYYTPVDAGLEGFHCDVGFDWKDFLEKATHQAVADDDERLPYLRSIKLSVDDDLRGTGALNWAAPANAPENSEDSVAKIRSGMEQMWAGFFQSWNGFYTGEILSVADSRTSVERTARGFHVITRDGHGVAEEQFNDRLVMQSLHVATPTLDSVMTPTFADAPQGRLVTVLRSVDRQPPSAPASEVVMRLRYATVNGFQLPSELAIEVAGTATFDYHLNSCTVKTRLTGK